MRKFLFIIPFIALFCLGCSQQTPNQQEVVVMPPVNTQGSADTTESAAQEGDEPAPPDYTMPTIEDDQQRAMIVFLAEYFYALNQGQYEKVIQSVDIDQLKESMELDKPYCPSLDIDDTNSVMECACMHMMYPCYPHPLKEIISAERKSFSAVQFRLTLQNEDGGTYAHTFHESEGPKTEFLFTVKEKGDQFVIE